MKCTATESSSTNEKAEATAEDDKNYKDDNKRDDLERVYYSRITLEKDFSFDQLYDFKLGECTCQRCKRREEFANPENTNYVQEILSKSENYPHLSRLIQFHLARKSKKDSESKDSTKQDTERTENLVSDEPEKPLKLPTPKPLEADATIPNKVIILKKDIGNGQFIYKAVPKGFLNHPSTPPKKQQFIKFLSTKPLHNISTNSLIKTAETLACKSNHSASNAPITYSKVSSSKQLELQAQSFEDVERKRIYDEQMNRIKKVSKQIASTLSKRESGENETSNGESDSLTEGNMLIGLEEEEEPEPSITTVYLPEEQVTMSSSSDDHDKIIDLYEEDESFEVSYTTGVGKNPLIITLYLKCPLAECERLFSSRNSEGCKVNITYQISEHLAVAHQIYYPAQCLLCEERFPKDHLKWHIRSVHETGAENERFQCCHCLETFFDCYEKLAKHYHKKHVQGRFMCAKEGCEHIANYKIDIYRHVAKAHHDHKCPVCGLTFQYRSTLLRHELQHSGRHKFACRYGSCFFTTTSKGGCLQHVRVRHLGLPLTKRSDPRGEDPRHVRLEKEAHSYVWFFDDSKGGRLMPASTAPRNAYQPSGLIRTIRKKVHVMKRSATGFAILPSDSVGNLTESPDESMEQESSENSAD